MTKKKPTATDLRRGSAIKTAERIRAAYVANEGYTGDPIHIEDLQGKIVEYVDLDCRTKTERVTLVGTYMIYTKDALGKKHRLPPNVITGAYPRKGAGRRQVAP